jgi:CDP-diacylglycerol--serine O-phosphatidyltransferase
MGTPTDQNSGKRKAGLSGNDSPGMSKVNDPCLVKTLPQRKSGGVIYILPNLLTTASLFAGFYAIMSSRLGQFEAACIALLAAMVMDMLDGRIARMTNTTSEFGSEYDSLADMVSFGVTPALVLYEWVLFEFGRVGSIAAFLFLACAALRLARFNTHSSEEKRFFSGMPSPAAAAVLGAMVWVGYDNELSGLLYNYAALILCVVSALAMVSNVQYRSFKDFDLKGHMPFIALIGVVLVVALIAVDPPLFFLGLALTYLISGPLLEGFESWRSSKADKRADDSVDNS